MNESTLILLGIIILGVVYISYEFLKLVRFKKTINQRIQRIRKLEGVKDDS